MGAQQQDPVAAQDGCRWRTSKVNAEHCGSAQLPCQPSQKKGDFSLSLSFCLFLNSLGLKQQLGSPRLQGLCCQQTPAHSLRNPASLRSSLGLRWSERTRPLEKDSKWGDVSVSKTMQYLIPDLSGIFIITDLLICRSLTAAADKDDDSWHTLTQSHNTSYHSRAEIHHYYLSTEKVSRLVLDTKCRRHLHWKANTVRASRQWGALITTLSPGSPSVASSSSAGPWAQGTHRVPHAPTADLAHGTCCKAVPWWRKKREGRTKIISLGMGGWKPLLELW